MSEQPEVRIADEHMLLFLKKVLNLKHLVVEELKKNPTPFLVDLYLKFDETIKEESCEQS